MSGAAWLWLLLQDAFWSGLATLGFAVVFNVPRRALLGCVLAGAVGHVIRTALMEVGLGMETATLAGATAIGFLGSVMARHWRAPSNLFTVSGAIPLVPGRFAFGAMMGIIQVATTESSSLLLEARLVEATVNGIKTGLIVGAIAIGIAMPTLLLQRHRPVV